MASFIKPIGHYLIHTVTLVRHKKPGSTQKCLVRHKNTMVRHKNARLDTKMLYPACISFHCHYQTSPFLWEIYCPILFKYFVYINPWRHEKRNHIDIKIYSISLWNMKCNYSFLFVMIIMSAAINKCYWYGSSILPTSVFSFDCSIRIWHTYSISQEICTRFCCALLCCGYAIVHNEFTWSIYPYSSGLLCWHWGNR